MTGTSRDKASPQKTEFSTWLARWIKERDVNVASLSALSGVSAGYISLLLSGRRGNPRRKVVDALATALQAPLDEARRAANLTVLSFGRPPQPIRMLLPPQPPSLGALVDDWSCQVAPNAVTVRADIKRGNEAIYTVRLHISMTDERIQTDTPSDYPRVRWLENDQERIKVCKPTEGIELTLQAGRHELRFQFGDEDPEIVLQVPIGLDSANTLLSGGPYEE